jgi:hypothetical protein
MNRALVHFLNKRTPLAEETAVWPWQDRQMPLRIWAYAGPELPPLDYVGSVRALLFRDDQIMVIEAEAIFRPIAEARALITDANLLQLLALALTREVS